MSETAVVEVAQQGLQVALILALPLLIASMVIGVVISLIQVATSLQDATLTFVPKILAVGLALFVMGPWMMRTVVAFAHRILISVGGVTG